MKSTLTVERPEPADHEADEISDFAGGVARMARDATLTPERTSFDRDLQSGTVARIFREHDLPRLQPNWKRDPIRGATFVALHSWEGVVESVQGDLVYVRLFDLFHDENPEVVTTISASEIDSEDRELMVEGAVFYWSVGFSQSSSGRRRSSIVRFRRLPAWTRGELSKAQEEANRLERIFGDENAW